MPPDFSSWCLPSSTESASYTNSLVCLTSIIISFHTVPHLSNPLTDLLSPKRTSADSFNLSKDVMSAFQAVKTALAKAILLPLLTHPDPTAPYCLMVDASNIALGGVLQQRINNTWQPISFFSKCLQPVKTKYCTFSYELLSIYLSIPHFRHFLEGCEFYVLTNHKPLIHALSSSSSHHSL